MPLSSEPFIISVRLALKLLRLCACEIQRRHSEFEPVACTARTGKKSVADELQRLWNGSLATDFKLRSLYFI